MKSLVLILLAGLGGTSFAAEVTPNATPNLPPEMLETAGAKDVNTFDVGYEGAWVYMKWVRPEWVGIQRHPY